MFLITHTACSNNQSIISSQSYNTINTGSLQPSSRHSNNSAPIPDYGYQSTGPSFYTNTANTSPNDYVSGKDIYSRLAHKTHLMHLRQWRPQTLLKKMVISLKTHEICVLAWFLRGSFWYRVTFIVTSTVYGHRPSLESVNTLHQPTYDI